MTAQATVAKTIASLIVRELELLAALEACVEVMTRVYPDGLPIQNGTLCEELDWDAAVEKAKELLNERCQIRFAGLKKEG